ncbi:unnamed protein product [Rhizophagus irregularis]|nr:unnamed protein product [Rhizophagus irregularis]
MFLSRPGGKSVGDTGKMISGTLITLFCLVRESKVPFKVALGRNNDVSDFKLNQPVLSKNREGLRGITLQDNENVTLLDETNDIVDYWAEEQIPLKKCIHVIVELLEQPVVASAWSSSVLTYEQPVTGKNKILTSGIAELQLQDKKLWVRYNDERVFLPENILGLLRVFNVDNAYEIIVEENDDVSSSSKEKGKEKEMEIKESNIEVKRIENAFHINYHLSLSTND